MSLDKMLLINKSFLHIHICMHITRDKTENILMYSYRQKNLSEGAARDAGLLDDDRQLLPELGAEHAVDDEVDGAVEDDEEPGDEVEDDGDHGHVVVLPRLVTPLHRVQGGHLGYIACVDIMYLVKYKRM